MYSQRLLLLLVALLLSFPCSSILSLSLFFGFSGELRSLISTLENDSSDQFLSLLRHSLPQICHHENQLRTNATSINLSSPFDASGGNNRGLLDISLPSIFRNITIDDNWNSATKRIRALEKCPAIGRFAGSGHPANNKSGWHTDALAEACRSIFS
jgi:hypothetical protein